MKRLYLVFFKDSICFLEVIKYFVFLNNFFLFEVGLLLVDVVGYRKEGKLGV